MIDTLKPLEKSHYQFNAKGLQFEISFKIFEEKPSKFTEDTRDIFEIKVTGEDLKEFHHPRAGQLIAHTGVSVRPEDDFRNKDVYIAKFSNLQGARTKITTYEIRRHYVDHMNIENIVERQPLEIKEITEKKGKQQTRTYTAFGEVITSPHGRQIGIPDCTKIYEMLYSEIVLPIDFSAGRFIHEVQKLFKKTYNRNIDDEFSKLRHKHMNKPYKGL